MALEIVPELKMCASRSLLDKMCRFFPYCGWFVKVYCQSKLPLQGMDCNHSLRHGGGAEAPDAFRLKDFKTALGFEKKAGGRKNRAISILHETIRKTFHLYYKNDNFRK